MKKESPHLLLRIAIFITLLAHSIPGIFNNGINEFGTFYLDKAGFAPFGLYIAWLVKASHIICAFCILLNRFLKPASLITIFILVMGIIMVHYPNGWFVVGAGRNGMEFNFLLICVLLTFIFPKWKFRGPAH